MLLRLCFTVAGLELYGDLLLADFLVTHGLASEVGATVDCWWTWAFGACGDCPAPMLLYHSLLIEISVHSCNCCALLVVMLVVVVCGAPVVGPALRSMRRWRFTANLSAGSCLTLCMPTCTRLWRSVGQGRPRLTRSSPRGAGTQQARMRPGKAYGVWALGGQRTWHQARVYRTFVLDMCIHHHHGQ
jgi:hypothetical protein